MKQFRQESSSHSKSAERGESLHGNSRNILRSKSEARDYLLALAKSASREVRKMLCDIARGLV